MMMMIMMMMMMMMMMMIITITNQRLLIAISWMNQIRIVKDSSEQPHGNTYACARRF